MISGCYVLMYLSAAAVSFAIMGDLFSAETCVAFIFSYFIWMNMAVQYGLVSTMTNFVISGCGLYISGIYVISLAAGVELID